MENLFLSFCQIHPWRLIRLPWDLVLLLPLVLARDTGSRHLHHASTSRVLPAFHHPSFLFGFTSAAVLLLPDVTSYRKWESCFWSSPWAANQQLPLGLSSGFLLAAKESCWFSLLFSYLPPPLSIFPVLVPVLVNPPCIRQVLCPVESYYAGPTSGSPRLFTFQKLIIYHHVLTLTRNGKREEHFFSFLRAEELSQRALPHSRYTVKQMFAP